eukprot:9482746-Pyramimonas_sp.AAC.1
MWHAVHPCSKPELCQAIGPCDPPATASTWNAASDPESVDVERFDVSEAADRSRLKDSRGVGNHRQSRDGTNL